jgi:Ca2+-binding RTX toxin-like protein
VQISETGLVAGEFGVALEGSVGEITNHGIIDGRTTGVVLSGSSGQLFNHGTIEGGRLAGAAGVVLSGPSASAYNYGAIQGQIGILSSGIGGVIFNLGSIVGTGSAGINVVASGKSVINDGDIRSATSDGIAGDQGLHLENNGEISGVTGVALVTSTASADHIVLNSGTITGETNGLLLAGGEIQSITNSGMIQSTSDWAIEVGSTGFSDLVLINTGTIQSTSGNGILGTDAASSSDTIVSSGGIFGVVSLLAGNDLVQMQEGGFVVGGIELGAGDDIAFGAGDADVIDGGGDNDFIVGGGGVDVLSGGSGIDIILGGTGADTIDGGSGIDFLLGEEGADVFLFTSTDDSPTGGDITSILDFEQGADIIDLYSIETSIAFLGDAAFSGGSGAELRSTNVGGVLSIVDFDVDGNGTSDLQLLVYGAIDMTRADFGL